MKTQEKTSPGWPPPDRPAALAIGGLSVFGLVGWFSFFSAADLVWRAVALVALLALAWFAHSTSRASADTRWRAEWDRYAAQPDAKSLA